MLRNAPEFPELMENAALPLSDAEDSLLASGARDGPRLSVLVIEELIGGCWNRESMFRSRLNFPNLTGTYISNDAEKRFPLRTGFLPHLWKISFRAVKNLPADRSDWPPELCQRPLRNKENARAQRSLQEGRSRRGWPAAGPYRQEQRTQARARSPRHEGYLPGSCASARRLRGQAGEKPPPRPPVRQSAAQASSGKQWSEPPAGAKTIPAGGQTAVPTGHTSGP